MLHIFRLAILQWNVTLGIATWASNVFVFSKDMTMFFGTMTDMMFALSRSCIGGSSYRLVLFDNDTAGKPTHISPNSTPEKKVHFIRNVCGGVSYNF